jgi:hypothetical protein
MLASLIAVPFVAGISAGFKLGGIWTGRVIAILGAVSPSLLFFGATQQADSITRAASLMAFPILIGLGLFLAGLGYLTGRGWSGS